MFERMIECIIGVLKFVLGELERAYCETYGDKKLINEFNAEVELRREANKELFVRNAAGFVGRKILDEEGYIIPPKQAMKIGEIWFNSAKEIGLIDNLNNIIE